MGKHSTQSPRYLAVNWEAHKKGCLRTFLNHRLSVGITNSSSFSTKSKQSFEHWALGSQSSGPLLFLGIWSSGKQYSTLTLILRSPNPEMRPWMLCRVSKWPGLYSSEEALGLCAYSLLHEYQVGIGYGWGAEEGVMNEKGGTSLPRSNLVADEEFSLMSLSSH